ncbi:CBS domain-containing protein [Cryptosporangium sp. NPDC051539]|uniref:CBS domain-containing protein n=1 Tax=Cryptosporangium sp. NPDC051539 TaxID=3363962 RepID=UPI0037AD024B
MTHRTVRDVMTTPVVTVDLDTPAKTIAQVLQQRRINAVPVVDRRHAVAGVVSEGDLLAKLAHADGEPVSRRRGAKARASVARELMSKPAVTVLPDATIVEAAKLMERRHVKTLPVVDGVGELVGIVTPGDVVAALRRPDQEIHREIVHKVFGKSAPPDLSVEVDDGVVTLRGQFDRLSSTVVLAGLVKRVDGVVRMVNELTYLVDDTIYTGA